MELSTVKDLAAIAQAVATVAAIIVGGVWSYMLFVRTRQRYPRAKIDHYITHRIMSGSNVLVHVGVTISNKGDVLLSLISAQTRIQQVLPVNAEIMDSISEGRDPVPKGEREIEWPLIGSSRKSTWEPGKREIEPGESETIYYDFIIESGIQAIEVYSYFGNASKPERAIGWNLTTLYDITSTP
jgi:hypothetical protein